STGRPSPRYYLADQGRPVADRGDFVKNVSTPRYTGRVACMTQQSFVPADGVIRRLRETANDAPLDVERFGRGFLVMSVTPHKYWRMTLDGHRVKPLTTNIGYQALIVPRGRHHIQMHY